MSILLDSDIAIEILRGRDKAILAKWSALIVSGAVVFYSPVTAAEVWAGAFPNEHQLITRFFRPLLCVETNYDIGQLAGDFLRKYARNHSLEISDAFIAATAVLRQSTLWTRNRKHYPMPGLTFYS